MLSSIIGSLIHDFLVLVSHCQLVFDPVQVDVLWDLLSRRDVRKAIMEVVIIGSGNSQDFWCTSSCVEVRLRALVVIIREEKLRLGELPWRTRYGRVCRIS